MATNETTLKLNVTSGNSLDKEITKGKELRDVLLQASKALASAARASPARASSAFAASAPERGTTGLARSVGKDGGTGSGSRDFARQATGLGGLVRLYATFAANIFAATAAFGALSRAMDTTNMVRGLDQLGVSSGKNLGTLSKRVVEATDYAISMREAMETVAKASASGMSDKQILGMTEAAKKASQALGVNMTDAMSRLTRGISKLEPELLDELGLFTKVDKSTQDYARSVGKATASLTDYERRQAFANAVIAEAKDKFSNINIDSNPYTKLAATFQNVAQAGLELVNKVLGPMARFLAESPTALAAAMALIGVTLLKTAIPAIGEMRSGLKKASSAAKEAAEEFQHSFDDKFQEKLAARFRIPDIEKNLARVREDIAKNTTLMAKAAIPASFNKRAVENLEKAMSIGVTEEDLSRVKRIASERQKALEKDTAGTAILSATKKAQKEQEMLAANSILASSQKNILAIQQEVALTKELAAANRQVEGEAGKKIRRTDPEMLAKSRLDSLRAKESSTRIVSLAAEDAQVIGLRNSWARLRIEVDKDTSLNKFQKLTTLAKGGGAAVMSRLAGFAGMLGTVGMVVGAATAAFEILQSTLGDNSAEVIKYASAVTDANAAAETLNKTLNELSKRADGGLSIKGIQALSNGLRGVATAAKDSADALQAAQDKANWFDKGLDFLKSAVGADLRSITGKSVAIQVMQALDAISDPKLKKEAEKRFKQLFNVKNLTKGSIEGAFSLEVSAERIITMNKGAAEGIAQLSKEQDRANISITNYSEVMEKSSKAYDEFTTSVRDTNPLSKMGDAMEDSGRAILATLNNVNTGLVALTDLANNANKLRFLPPEAMEELATAIPRLERIKTTIGILREQSRELGTKIADKKATGAGRYEIEGLKQQKAIRDVAIRDQEEAALRILDLQKKGADAIVEAGLKLSTAAYNSARALAGIGIAKAIGAGASGLGVASAQADLQRRELSLQEQSITAMQELTIATIRATNIQEELGLKRMLEAGTTSEKEYAGKQLGVVGIVKGILSSNDFAKALSLYKDSGTSSDVKAALVPIIRALRDTATKRVGISGKLAETNITERMGTAKEERAAAQEVEQYDISRANRLKDITKALSGQSDIVSDSILDMQAQSALEADRLTALRESRDLGFKIAEQQRRVDESSGTQKESYSKELTRLNTVVLSQLTEEQKARKVLLEQQLEMVAIASRYAAARKDADLRSEDFAMQAAFSEQQAAADADHLTFLERSNALTSAASVSMREQLDLRRAANELAKEQERAESDRLRKLLDLGKDLAGRSLSVSAMADGTDRDRAQASLNEYATTEVSRINSQQEKQLSLAKQIYDQRVKQVGLLAEEESRQLRINEAMTYLADVLGNLGTQFGSIVSALDSYAAKSAKIAKDEKANAEELAAARMDVDSGEDNSAAITKVHKLEKDGIKLAKDKAKVELDTNLSIISSSKKMFSEKTAAHKLLATAERAMHVYKLGMMIQEAVAGWTLTSQVVAQNQAKVASSAPAAGAKATADTPGPVWVKVAAGLAAFAFVMSLMSGSPKGVPSGMSAADRQETQGTGTSWVNGNKVETGAGVFGDSSAKSESINKSLEVLKDNSIDGLTYSSKMVKLLENISNSIAGAAKGLYGIQGLRIGSAFGTQEGSSSGGGLLGSGLFSSKSSKSITDSGLVVEGTFRQLAGMISGSVVSMYEDVLSTSKTWYGKTKSSMSRSMQDVPEATEYIRDIFAYSLELFDELGTKIGMTSQEINTSLDKLGKIDFEASLRGLSGEDLEKEVSAVLSSKLDEASTAVFSSLERYKEFGEGFLETVVRIIDSAEKVNLALYGMSATMLYSGNVINAAAISASDALVKAAGGLDEFLSKTAFFTDNFLTEAEALAPVQARLVSELNKLGITGLDTREKFARLVQGLDLGTIAGQQLYTELMGMSEAFAKVYQETRKVLSAEEAKIALLDQQISIYKLEGLTALATMETRKKELATLDKSLIAGQLYIYALEDEAALKDKVSSTLKSSISSLTTYIKTLQTFKTSLITGSLSNLTSQEKYAELTRQIAETARLTRDTSITEEKRAEAINALPTLGNSFLEASRTLYASSDKYSEDFSFIQRVLDEATSSLVDERGVAERTLSELGLQTGALSTIAENTKATADSIASLNIALGNTAKTAADAAVGGLLITGSSTAPTNQVGIESLFRTFLDGYVVPSQDALLVEIKNLTAEVIKLREEQIAIAQEAIVSAVVSNEAIVEAIVETAVEELPPSWYVDRDGGG